MFSLNDTCRYWLYNKPVVMRKIFNRLNGPDNLSYGYEDELMSRLSVSGNTPAYWGYVDLPDGITAKQVWDSATQSYEYVKEDGKYVVEDVVAEKFQKVPMVRNFAWLTVGTSSSVTN